VFQDRWDAKVCLTHDFGKLIDLAGLRTELNNRLAASAAAGGTFATNWTTASLWKAESRYVPRTEAEAKALYAAIADKPDGVLKWIQKFW
jgi:hypothetical protein